MKIGHIELFVNDVTQSKDFFCNILGFDLVTNQDQVTWVKLSGMEILLRPKNNNTKPPSYQDATHGIVLYSDNLEKDILKLKNKGLEFQGYDGDCLTFTDLDNHWFQLVDPSH